jgi:hypothetical protein
MDKITENGPVPALSRLGEYISLKNSHRIYHITPNKETLIINIMQ